MIRSIIDYVKYHYQFCENIEPFILTNNLDTNKCYIKSCLIYKYLYELYFRKNITLREVMSSMDNTDFIFIMNSPVLKNHLIFHHAFKSFWKRHKKGRHNIYIFDTRMSSPNRLQICNHYLYLFFSNKFITSFLLISIHLKPSVGSFCDIAQP